MNPQTNFTQADFTAEPPKDKTAPWQRATSPRGESTWDRSKQAREHPEWFTTAHGTTDRLEQREDEPNQMASTLGAEDNGSSTHKNKHKRKMSAPPQMKRSSLSSYMDFGHTVQQGHSYRSVHRDLDNI